MNYNLLISIKFKHLESLPNLKSFYERWLKINLFLNDNLVLMYTSTISFKEKYYSNLTRLMQVIIIKDVLPHLNNT